MFGNWEFFFFKKFTICDGWDFFLIHFITGNEKVLANNNSWTKSGPTPVFVQLRAKNGIVVLNV